MSDRRESVNGTKEFYETLILINKTVEWFFFLNCLEIFFPFHYTNWSVFSLNRPGKCWNCYLLPIPCHFHWSHITYDIYSLYNSFSICFASFGIFECLKKVNSRKHTSPGYATVFSLNFFCQPGKVTFHLDVLGQQHR